MYSRSILCIPGAYFLFRIPGAYFVFQEHTCISGAYFLFQGYDDRGSGWGYQKSIKPFLQKSVFLYGVF